MSGDLGPADTTLIVPRVTRVVAGRYALLEPIGEGGSGVVHRAQDRFTGDTVAVKSLRPGFLATKPRVRREIAALRLLRIRGVVTLRDEVEEGEEVHLVMDLVDGTPFPGRGVRADWESLGPRVRALLEILGRVHAAGVVHRDLKPHNVLVDRDGRVTLVDFGLSYGPVLGAALTKTDAIVGTPSYLAPEQVRGKGIDGRCDLYALGTMVYECLAGCLPLVADDLAELLTRKLSGSIVPLARIATEVPREVARVVDQLLAVDRNDRPQSAAEALRLLFGDGAPEAGEPLLPLLGRREPLERVLTAARAGRSIDVRGRRGSGRTHLLTRAAETLEGEGAVVRWVGRGRSPYESLAPLLGGFDGLEDMTQDEAFAVLDERLAKLLADGTVLCVDPPEHVDAWSLRALERGREHGSILRTASSATLVDAEPGCVELAPLEPAELRVIFAGPSRIQHLPEDAADELWRRTGGQPGRVRSELSAWVRHGIATWVGDRVRIERAALNRLHGGLPVGGDLLVTARSVSHRSSELEDLLAWIALAWPHADLDLLARVVQRPRWTIEPEIELLADDGFVNVLADGRVEPLVVPEVLQLWSEATRRDAHRALADALPHGILARLRHLAAAGDPRELVAEALVTGRRLRESGNTGDARAALAQALDVARRELDVQACEDLLHEFTATCLSEGTLGAANEALYEIDRAPGDTDGLRRMRELLRGVVEAHAGEPAQALELLDRCGPFADPELELWRHCQRVRAAHALPVETQADVLDQIAAWATATGNARARANHHTWMAHLLRRRGAYLEAAERFLEAYEEDERVPVRMANALNAGTSFLDAGRLEQAREAAHAVRDLAAGCRHPVYEAYAESLARDALYRSSGTGVPDVELVEAVRDVGIPELEPLVALTEAAFAWRGGDLALARDLAERAAQQWTASGRVGAALIARGLVVACDGSAPEADVRALIDAALAHDDPFDALQALALVAPAAGAHGPRALAGIRDRVDALDPAERSLVREVLSPDACLARAMSG